MKFRILSNITVIVALIILTLLMLLVGGCGIPSYTYLYPPTADPYAADAVLTFTHDEDNDQAVFKGYEIYYRFYALEPNSAGTSLAENDMQNYFTSSYQISSIISTINSAAYTYGFRRAIVYETPDDTPQLSINPPSQIENSFQVELLQPTDPTEPIKLTLSYDNSINYTLFRSVIDADDNYKSFYPRINNYTESDPDIVDEEININVDFYVAFFAVPYGFDLDALQELYANGSYEGMEYIGRFKIQ